MPNLDTPDTIIMNLTSEGRNLIARVKLGSLCYQVENWQMGCGGYQDLNVVKVEPILDIATNAVGYIEVVDNTNFSAGDQVVLNGVEFIRSIDWIEGSTAAQTAQNILSAIQDSTDPGVDNLVQCSIDPTNSARIVVTSLVTGNVLEGKIFTFLPAAVDTVNNLINYPNHGFAPYMQVEIDTTGTLPGGLAAATPYYIASVTTDTFQLSSTLNTPTIVSLTSQGTGIHQILPTGNLYPINRLETAGLGDTQNFSVTPMSLSLSNSLIYAAYPVPPSVGTFLLPEGRIETPTPTSISFVMRIPDGPVGLNAYGEIGLYATVINSFHPMEIGRQLLFAVGHFPIQSKTDRHLFTYRVIINF